MDGKPQFLYHGSENRNIEEFEPRNEKIRNPEEGPVIFATPNEAEAAKFLVPSTDSWVAIGKFSFGSGSEELNYIIISDEDRFRSLDAGGAIYKLPAEKFSLESKYGGGSNEWTSRENVRPISKVEYDSGLDAMLDHKINVYFVDKETFRNIREADDHGLGIIRSIEPYRRKSIHQP